MNKKAIQEFVDAEYNKYTLAHQEKQVQQQQIQSLIDAFAPVRKDDYTIVNKNTGEVIVEFDDGKPRNNFRSNSLPLANLKIKDHLGNLVAVIHENNERPAFPVYWFHTYNDSIFKLDKSGPIQTVQMEAVHKLILNGYLGEGEHSIAFKQKQATEIMAANKAAVKAAAEDFEKRVNVQGILTLTDGKVLEGDFRIEFRETIDGYVEKGNIANLDGKTIRHYYVEKGKNKSKVYKEKDIQSFQVINENDPDYDEYYCKIEYMHTPAKADIVTSDGALDAFALGKNLFGNKPKKKTALAYRAVDMPRMALYLSGNDILIQEKESGVITEINKQETNEQLKQIASDCPSVLEEIDNGKYGYGRMLIFHFFQDLYMCRYASN